MVFALLSMDYKKKRTDKNRSEQHKMENSARYKKFRKYA